MPITDIGVVARPQRHPAQPVQPGAAVLLPAGLRHGAARRHQHRLRPHEHRRLPAQEHGLEEEEMIINTQNCSGYM